jgi:hypothetical protein
VSYPHALLGGPSIYPRRRGYPAPGATGPRLCSIAYPTLPPSAVGPRVTIGRAAASILEKTRRCLQRNTPSQRALGLWPALLRLYSRPKSSIRKAVPLRATEEGTRSGCTRKASPRRASPRKDAQTRTNLLRRVAKLSARMLEGFVPTESNAYRGDEPADRRPYDRPAQHVARIVHTHVDARVGDG